MPRDEEQWLKYLIRQHDRELHDLRSLNDYYEGRQQLSYLAPELVVEMQDRVRPVIVNWPRLIVDSLEERLDVEGFRLVGAARGDTRLQEWWQANDLDEESQLGHVDGLSMRRFYVMIGSRVGDTEADQAEERLLELGEDPDLPLITVESPLEVYAVRDPRTRRVLAALKRWKEDLEEGKSPTEFANLYLPDATSWWVKERGRWNEVDRDDHNLGVVMVVPGVNRARTSDRRGVSELQDVIPLSDAACKVCTDMMVSAEYHAIPRRVAFGFDQSDFVDEDGRPVNAFSRVVGRMWATERTKTEGADVVQFPEATLSNFHNTINSLAAIVASLSGMPPHYLGLTTDNPASADAIRSAESRLIKRAERKQRAFGGTWETAMRIADRVVTGEWNPDLRALETIWRDPSTPTIAQAADAAVKKYAAGIVPLRHTREDLGYTQPQIALMEEADADEDPLTRGMSRPAVTAPKPPQNAPEAEEPGQAA